MLERPAEARPRGSGRPRGGFAFRHVEGSGGQVGAELRNLQPPGGGGGGGPRGERQTGPGEAVQPRPHGARRAGMVAGEEERMS